MTTTTARARERSGWWREQAGSYLHERCREPGRALCRIRGLTLMRFYGGSRDRKGYCCEAWVLGSDGTRNRCKPAITFTEFLLSAKKGRLWQKGHRFVRSKRSRSKLIENQ